MQRVRRRGRGAPPGSVSGSAIAASVTIAALSAASTTKMPSHDVTLSNCAPSTGARIGARPVTSISELKSFAACAPE